MSLPTELRLIAWAWPSTTMRGLMLMVSTVRLVGRKLAVMV
jgi:hypothetical protein